MSEEGELPVPSHVWEYCVTDEEAFQIYNIGMGVMMIIAAVLTLAILAMYLKAKLAASTTAFKTGSCQCCGSARCNLYWLGLVLFLSGFICLAFAAIARLTICDFRYATLYAIFYNVATQAYVANYFVLIALLFARLVSNFELTGTLQVSKRFKVVFWCLYASTIVCGVLVAWLFTVAPAAASMLVIVASLQFLALIVVLAYAFVHKLLIVHQSKDIANAANYDGLKMIITKSSMLSFISLVLSMFTFIMLTLYSFLPSVHVDFCSDFILCIDVASNAVCILLSFKHFSGYYDLLCTACDSRWLRFWKKLTLRGTDSRGARELNKVVSVSVSPDSSVI